LARVDFFFRFIELLRGKIALPTRTSCDHDRNLFFSLHLNSNKYYLYLSFNKLNGQILTKGDNMAEETSEITTWTDLAAGLYDKLTGKNAEISYEFVNFDLGVPMTASPSAEIVTWKLNGLLKIRTKEV